MGVKYTTNFQKTQLWKDPQEVPQPMKRSTRKEI